MPDETVATPDFKKRAHFGRKLRAARRRSALSQGAVAEHTGITLGQVCHLERGRSWPSLPVYFKICAVLELGDVPLTGR